MMLRVCPELDYMYATRMGDFPTRSPFSLPREAKQRKMLTPCGKHLTILFLHFIFKRRIVHFLFRGKSNILLQKLLGTAA